MTIYLAACALRVPDRKLVGRLQSLPPSTLRPQQPHSIVHVRMKTAYVEATQYGQVMPYRKIPQDTQEPHACSYKSQGRTNKREAHGLKEATAAAHSPWSPHMLAASSMSKDSFLSIQDLAQADEHAASSISELLR